MVRVEVPPRSVADRHRLVGLLDPGLDLLEQRLDQLAVGVEEGGGVVVLGLQVGDRVGIVAVEQPRERVLDGPGRAFPRVWFGRCDGLAEVGRRRSWRPERTPPTSIPLPCEVPCASGSTRTCARATDSASTTARTCSCSSRTASPTSAGRAAAQRPRRIRVTRLGRGPQRPVRHPRRRGVPR